MDLEEHEAKKIAEDRRRCTRYVAGDGAVLLMGIGIEAKAWWVAKMLCFEIILVIP